MPERRFFDFASEAQPSAELNMAKLRAITADYDHMIRQSRLALKESRRILADIPLLETGAR